MVDMNHKLYNRVTMNGFILAVIGVFLKAVDHPSGDAIVTVAIILSIVAISDYICQWRELKAKRRRKRAAK